MDPNGEKVKRAAENDEAEDPKRAKCGQDVLSDGTYGYQTFMLFFFNFKLHLCNN